MRLSWRWLVGPLICMSASAHAIPVEEFLARTEALRAKGMMALLSPDASLMKQEIVTSGKAWRAQAARANPRVCAPARVGLKSDDLINILQAVPAAERRTLSVEDALIRELNRRYRCR